MDAMVQARGLFGVVSGRTDERTAMDRGLFENGRKDRQ
jgi:hypothetical protein